MDNTIPKVEEQLKDLRSHIKDFIRLPGDVSACCQDFLETKKILTEKMDGLDNKATKGIDIMRKDIMDQFTRVHKDLDEKINDVERKSMSFT